MHRIPQEERSGLQTVLDAGKEDLGVTSKADEAIKSNEHLIRLGCAAVMFLFGFVIISIHYILVFVKNGSAAGWDREELFLVLILIIGSVGIVFTKTVLAILNVVWPFRRGK